MLLRACVSAFPLSSINFPLVTLVSMTPVTVTCPLSFLLMIGLSNADKGAPELYPRRKGIVLIQLTRLNGNPIALNSDLIKFVENAPDTVITLINGEKIIVRETSDDVIHRIVDFRRSVMAGLPSWSGSDVNSAILRPQDPHPARSPEGFRRG